MDPKKGGVMQPPAMAYETLFSRNFGVFRPDEQARIEQARVLVVGDSGSGENMAIQLARCGVGRLTVAGEGIYEPADMNRQIGCFLDTLGRRKTGVIREEILSIHPRANVTIRESLPDAREMARLMAAADVVIPAVEDLAYSVLLFRAARDAGKPAVLCMPSGMMGWVSVFSPSGPTIEDMLGIPVLDYEGLVCVTRTPEFRCAQYHYITDGDWRVDWFFSYFRGEKPLALLCAAEWLLASLAVLETLKVITGKWPPVAAPHCWKLRNGRIATGRFSLLARAHRRLGWLLFGSPEGLRRHRWTHRLWKGIFRHLRRRQDGKRS